MFSKCKLIPNLMSHCCEIPFFCLMCNIFFFVNNAISNIFINMHNLLCGLSDHLNNSDQ